MKEEKKGVKRTGQVKAGQSSKVVSALEWEPKIYEDAERRKGAK